MSDFLKCINPATLEEFAEVKITQPNFVQGVVEKARKAQPEWAALSFSQRAKYLLRAREYLLKHIDDFAESITLDNGKPLTESLTAEIYPVADLIYYFAKNTKKLLKPKGICLGIWHLLGRFSKMTYQPYGVIGMISPWNFPFSIPVGTTVIALMAGNTVVLKPSSSTAYVGQKIEELFRAAGLPEGVFNHIPGTSKTGEALLDTNVDKIFFTGSTNVGHHVMDKCAESLTPCNLELGGKDPMIVLKDANIEHASSAAVWGSFTNAGQCCASVERVYVHEDIADKFINLVVGKTSHLKIGLGTDPRTEVGPLTTESQLKIVESQVKDAKKRGARIPIGGERPTSLKGYFYKPTVITNVTREFDCVKDESFGPIMPILTFKHTKDAVKHANDSPYGLNAYIWTKNIKEGKKIASKLKCGTVAINECVYTHALPQTPWGGVKKSGYGRTHGQIGLMSVVNPLHIHANHCTHFKDIWWYNYNENLFKTFKHLAKLMTGGIFKKILALPIFAKTMLRK